MSEPARGRKRNRPPVGLGDVVQRANKEIQEDTGVEGYYSLLSVSQKHNAKKGKKAKKHT